MVRVSGGDVGAGRGDVKFSDVSQARTRLRGVIIETPLVPFESRPDGTRCLLKAESLQVTGAFKVRGAYNAIAALKPSERAAGVVSYSTGNHAIGVAFAARLLGVHAAVVMASSSPGVKQQRVRDYGAELVIVDGNGEALRAVASDIATRRGLVPIWSYDDARVIAGQGTIGLELQRQLRERSKASRRLTVIVPIGGGGLAAGLVVALRDSAGVSLVGVEPAVAPKTRASIDAGRTVRWPADEVQRTCADGLRVGELGRLPFEIISSGLDAVVPVEEAAIEEGVRVAAASAHLVVEPAGAASLAAWLAGGVPVEGRQDVVCILSGGNVDLAAYRRLLRGRSRLRPVVTPLALPT